MKKQVLSLALAAVMGLSLVAVSAETASADEAASLVMAWWGNQTRTDNTNAALAKYTEKYGVEVTGQPYQWDDYWAKLSTMSAGGELPDIVQMDFAYIDQYVNADLLVDLTPYIESGALDMSNVDDSVLEMGQVGDGIYGIAAGVNAPCFYYNKNIVEEAGVELDSTSNLTWDQFVEISKTIYEKTGYRANVLSGGALFKEWSRAEGISVTEAKCPVSDPSEYEAFFQMELDGVADGWLITSDVITEAGSGIETSPLVTESCKCWCVINGGSNLLVAFQAAAPEGVEIGLSALPTSDVTKSNYLKPAMFFSVSAQSSDIDASIALLNYLINDEDANTELKGERGVPASSAIADMLYATADDTTKQIYDYVNDVITPNCSPIDPPDPDGWSEVNKTLQDLQEELGYSGCKTTAAEAAQTLYDKMIEVWGE